MYQNKYNIFLNEIIGNIMLDFLYDNSKGKLFEEFYIEYKRKHTLKKSERRMACYKCLNNIKENAINFKIKRNLGPIKLSFHESCLDYLVDIYQKNQNLENAS